MPPSILLIALAMYSGPAILTMLLVHIWVSTFNVVLPIKRVLERNENANSPSAKLLGEVFA